MRAYFVFTSADDSGRGRGPVLTLHLDRSHRAETLGVLASYPGHVAWVRAAEMMMFSLEKCKCMSAKLTMQYHDAVELHLPNLCMTDSYLASITHVYCGPTKCLLT